MPKIIKDKQIVDDNWIVVEKKEDGTLNLPNAGSILVSLEDWLENKDLLSQQTDLQLGLALTGDDEPEDLAGDLEKFALITILFPAFKDGRGYSIARLLRDRYGYQGELRAVGDVLRDQIFYLQRCGFNSFAVREDRCIEDALHAFNDFTVTYQGACDDPRPHYSRS